jgi:hypothetical protein
MKDTGSPSILTLIQQQDVRVLHGQHREDDTKVNTDGKLIASTVLHSRNVAKLTGYGDRQTTG